MKIFIRLIVLLVLSLRGVAFAQIAPPPKNEWSHGTTRASFDLSQGVLPDFYQGPIAGNTSVAGTTVTFNDPSFILGGGVSLFVTRHIAIRPDVDVKIVRRNSQSYAVTAVAVRLAYHFEEHPLESFSAR